MADVVFTWNGPQMLTAVQQTMMVRMKTAVEYLRSRVVKNISTSGRGGNASKPGQFPHARTGKLRQSIYGVHEGSKKQVAGRVGTSLIYGRALELGATIRPKNARALTIPMTEEAEKRPAKQFKRPLSLVWPTGSKHGWLVEQKGKKTVLQYLLVRKVALKPRPFLRPTLNQEWPTVQKILLSGSP
jgi:hypothetical protein